ncbi:MAG: hypothetical protein M1825_005127 [Sarcosagium campestre]|nr:MAG: hypothetical protein M1825_005127 [Sarcosagium campestre]
MSSPKTVPTLTATQEEDAPSKQPKLLPSAFAADDDDAEPSLAQPPQEQHQPRPPAQNDGPSDSHSRTRSPSPAARQQEQEQPTHPTNFAPFFTLIEDAATSTHHHPTVHYLFSDDDPDLTTQISLQALSVDSKLQTNSSPPSPRRSASYPPDDDGIDSSDDSLSAEQQLLRRQQRRHHGAENPSEGDDGAESVTQRYVILDMNATGDAAVAARSLTDDWQVVGVEVASAPTWAADEGPPSATVGRAGGGLMLKIEGTEGIDPAAAALVTTGVGGGGGAATAGGGGVGNEVREDNQLDDLQQLVGKFERQMKSLQRVMDAEQGVGGASQRN